MPYVVTGHRYYRGNIIRALTGYVLSSKLSVVNQFSRYAEHQISNWLIAVKPEVSKKWPEVGRLENFLYVFHPTSEIFTAASKLKIKTNVGSR